MANTTNFGWETPDDTDLVKDGASAIRTLGSAIDTSLVDLKGGTTGQVLAKASNTDMDFTWSSVDPLTILDAKGDLITATAADTPARLAVGTNGQYLKANSSTATGLEWGDVSAGGMTSLATGTLSGASVTLSSINQTYNDLSLRIYKPSVATTSGNMRIRINGITTSSYNWSYNDSITTTIVSTTGNAGWDLFSIPTSNTNNYFQIDFPAYALVSGQTVGKFMKFEMAIESNGYVRGGRAFCDTATANAPITQIEIISTGGNWDAGTYTLWGIK